MMFIIRVILFSLFTTQAFSAEPPQLLTYLGTNDYPLLNNRVIEQSDFQFEGFNVDDLSNLEKEITKALPDNREEAEQIANQRLEMLDEERSTNIFKGIARLVQWDIKKLPAFVFGDGQYVVYGVRDAGVAIKRFMNSRKR